MLSPESIETPTSEKKMVGSVLIMEAESLAAVKKIVEEDIYYTSGVVSNLLLVGGYINHHTTLFSGTLKNL